MYALRSTPAGCGLRSPCLLSAPERARPSRTLQLCFDLLQSNLVWSGLNWSGQVSSVAGCRPASETQMATATATAMQGIATSSPGRPPLSARAACPALIEQGERVSRSVSNQCILDLLARWACRTAACPSLACCDVHWRPQSSCIYRSASIDKPASSDSLSTSSGRRAANACRNSRIWQRHFIALLCASRPSVRPAALLCSAACCLLRVSRIVSRNSVLSL